MNRFLDAERKQEAEIERAKRAEKQIEAQRIGIAKGLKEDLKDYARNKGVEIDFEDITPGAFSIRSGDEQLIIMCIERGHYVTNDGNGNVQGDDADVDRVVLNWLTKQAQ